MNKTKKILFSLAVFTAISIPTSAFAEFHTYDFGGAFTLLDSGGNPLVNSSNGLPRTPIEGYLSYDSDTLSGNIFIKPFDFFGQTWDTTVGTFVGGGCGSGPCIEDTLWSASMLVDYGSEIDTPVSVVWDNTGLLDNFGGPVGTTVTGVGALPASDGMLSGTEELGPTPVATTTWNAPIPFVDDGIGGSPLQSGTFSSFSPNFDLTTMELLDSNALCFLGSCQNNPLLPTAQDLSKLEFYFEDVFSTFWYDPPSADGYLYTMTSDSLFTGIVDFPTSFNSLFQVEAEGVNLGLFGPGDSVDFVSLLGHGVNEFLISGIDPNTDATDGAAFPLQLEFNTTTASFTMAAQAVPLPASVWLFGSGLLGLLGMTKRRSAREKSDGGINY